MSIELLDIGANVQTAFGALGLLTVLVLFGYYRHLRNTEITLKELPKDQRSKFFEPYLRRLNVEASKIAPGELYELIRLDLEKRASHVNLITIVVAAVFVICFTTASLVQKSPAINSTQIIPGDLTPIFGKVNGVDRVKNLPHDENNKNLLMWFSNSQNNIKIVTMNGSSWIGPNLMGKFENAIERIPVTIFLTDFTDKQSTDIWNRTMTEYKRESTWSEKNFRDNFEIYKKLLNSSKTLDKNRHTFLTIGLYNDYPWSRFTIFDDRAVSFIITPVVESGDDVLTYFSEDPFIVECFEQVFKRIAENTNRRGRMFTDSAAAEQFILQWESSLSAGH